MHSLPDDLKPTHQNGVQTSTRVDDIKKMIGRLGFITNRYRLQELLWIATFQSFPLRNITTKIFSQNRKSERGVGDGGDQRREKKKIVFIR
jgi:hypothetical protein